MATAPTPPTKPISPTAPTVSPVTLTTSADSPANANATSGDKGNNGLSGVGKEIEGLTKAFQGTSAQPSSADKSSLPSKTESPKTETTKIQPIGSSATQDGGSTKTAIPVNNQIPENKVSSSGYVWFVVVVMAVAAGLLLLRFYRDRKKQPRASTAIEHPERTSTIKDEHDLDMVLSQQSTAPKAKSSFEVRI